MASEELAKKKAAIEEQLRKLEEQEMEEINKEIMDSINAVFDILAKHEAKSFVYESETEGGYSMRVVTGKISKPRKAKEKEGE